MEKHIDILGAGLAGSEAALQLADRGVFVRLIEMRPECRTAVHATDRCAELVCSNSLKSEKPDSAAGMLKAELAALSSQLFEIALQTRVAAGGALAVDSEAFSRKVTERIERHPNIELVRKEATDIPQGADAVVLATGPLTSEALASRIERICGCGRLSFFDAAAPIVMADSLDRERLFSQSRYEEGEGDYLNAPFSKESYEAFIAELVGAERVVAKDFETRELFQACQPIEEIARKGVDAPRFGTLKPVGLTDPATGKRPWAALQLRAEDAHAMSYNLVGFQTNLTFSEQRRVFRMIPGLEHAEFARYGVMHRNTFIDAPRLLGPDLKLAGSRGSGAPLFVAGQLAGTEGYCEAIMSGLHAAINVFALLGGKESPIMPHHTAFGSLMAYATDPSVADYQPMHVNFGIMEPLSEKVKNKRARYAAYAERGRIALDRYCEDLARQGLLDQVRHHG